MLSEEFGLSSRLVNAIFVSWSSKVFCIFRDVILDRENRQVFTAEAASIFSTSTIRALVIALLKLLRFSVILSIKECELSWIGKLFSSISATDSPKNSGWLTSTNAPRIKRAGFPLSSILLLKRYIHVIINFTLIHTIHTNLIDLIVILNVVSKQLVYTYTTQLQILRLSKVNITKTNKYRVGSFIVWTV